MTPKVLPNALENKLLISGNFCIVITYTNYNYNMVGSELHHPNINPFIGCIVESDFTAIMTNYCSRRSLKTILTNSEFILDCLFKLSFISDAAMGLQYLHSKKIIHERLHLNNCLVDEHWTLKLSGMVAIIVTVLYISLVRLLH